MADALVTYHKILESEHAHNINHHLQSCGADENTWSRDASTNAIIVCTTKRCASLKIWKIHSKYEEFTQKFPHTTTSHQEAQQIWFEAPTMSDRH